MKRSTKTTSWMKVEYSWRMISWLPRLSILLIQSNHMVTDNFNTPFSPETWTPTWFFSWTGKLNEIWSFIINYLIILHCYRNCQVKEPMQTTLYTENSPCWMLVLILAYYSFDRIIDRETTNNDYYGKGTKWLGHGFIRACNT